MSENSYEFTNKWFETQAEYVWKQILPLRKPRRILEIGSYEGRASCYLIENNNWCENLELVCIDTWEGGIEHVRNEVDMSAVEKRFDKNIIEAKRLAKNSSKVVKLKGYSDMMMMKLITDGLSGYFDFIYVDGSHQAPDVLMDALLAFKLCKVDGMIVFDDYIWTENVPERDLLRAPKMAVDAFTNIFYQKTRIFNAPIYQVFVIKTSD